MDLGQSYLNQQQQGMPQQGSNGLDLVRLLSGLGALGGGVSSPMANASPLGGGVPVVSGPQSSYAPNLTGALQIGSLLSTLAGLGGGSGGGGSGGGGYGGGSSGGGKGGLLGMLGRGGSKGGFMGQPGVSSTQPSWWSNPFPTGTLVNTSQGLPWLSGGGGDSAAGLADLLSMYGEG